jgi:phosphoribosyl 1,2-cyclic phosphodiesterase
MRLIPLASSSRGNATLLEFGRTRVLVDAGLAAKTLAGRLEAVGVDPRTLSAIVLSHEHEDHARGVERFSKKHGIPVISSMETLEAMDRSPQHFAEWRPFERAGLFDLGPVRVEPFPVPHDAARPLGFVVHGEGLRIGIATDLGHATALVRGRLRGCNVLMVEFNHDDRMLERGPYPWHLKQRVAGRLGHLSNAEAADVVAEAADEACRFVVLAHLSEKNNTRELARRSAAAALRRGGRAALELRVAEADGPSAPVCL